MAKTINGGNSSKADAQFVTGKNAESSSTIYAGQPVVLAINGTDDGIAVVLPSGSAALKAQRLCFGVATQDMAVGATAPIQVYGFCRKIRLARNTRDATDSVWPSRVALTVGMALDIDTVNDAFTVATVPTATYGVLTGAAVSDSIAVDFGMLKYFAPAVLCSSQASTTTATSATTYAVGTVSTMTAKAFLRLL